MTEEEEEIRGINKKKREAMRRDARGIQNTNYSADLESFLFLLRLTRHSIHGSSGSRTKSRGVCASSKTNKRPRARYIQIAAER